jgi:hypothetical protein
MGGDYLHSLRRDSQGNPIQGLNNLYSFDPVSQVFADNKYQLKFPKNAMVCEGQGSKAYFAGGVTLNETGSTYVMVDDVDELEVIPPVVEGLEATQRWTYAKWRLSVPRMYLASARNGNLIAFGGGVNTNLHEFAIYANVDILDIETGQMNYTHMTVSRYLHAMASVGPYILLAGGVNYFGYIKSVDIYDTRHRNFTNFPNGLTRPRAILAGAATPTKAFFAGGFDGGVLSDVDMFDSVTGLFSPVTPLKEGRYSLIGVGVLDFAMFGGGRRRDGVNPSGSKYVDIYEDKFGNHTFREMDSPRFMHFGGAANKYIIFGLGISNDPGIQNYLEWLDTEKVLSIDVFDVSVLKKVIHGGLRSNASGYSGWGDVGIGIVPLPSINETETLLSPTSVPMCAETRAWKELREWDQRLGRMRTGGLGHLMIDDEMEVWMCVQRRECLGDIYNLGINVASPDHYKLPEWVVTYKEHLHHALAGGSNGNSFFLVNNNILCKS